MKKLLLLVSVLVLSMSLMACGSEEKGNDEKANDSAKAITGAVADIAKKLVDEGKFTDEVVEVENADMINQKLDIDGEKTEEMVCYYGTGDSSNIVYVAKFKEAADASAAKSKLETYLSELKTANESYDPEELGKIDNAILEIDGQYAIMVISDDNDSAKDIIDGFRK